MPLFAFHSRKPRRETSGYWTAGQFARSNARHEAEIAMWAEFMGHANAELWARDRRRAS